MNLEDVNMVRTRLVVGTLDDFERGLTRLGVDYALS